MECSAASLPPVLPRAEQAWATTERAWREAVPSLEHSLAPSDAWRAYAVLRGLTTRGGGMVAAATTSLPERAEQGRNYDYRYVWIRDQSFAGQAAAAASAPDLLDAAVRFVSERLLTDGPRFAPAYTVHGHAVPGQREATCPATPAASTGSAAT